MRYRNPKPSIVAAVVAATVVVAPAAVIVTGSGPTPVNDENALADTVITDINLASTTTAVLDLVESGLAEAGVTLPKVDLSALNKLAIPGLSAQDQSLQPLDLAQLDLSGLNLGTIDLAKLDLAQLQSSGLDLTKLDLSGVDLSKLNLDGLNLDGLTIPEIPGSIPTAGSNPPAPVPTAPVPPALDPSSFDPATFDPATFDPAAILGAAVQTISRPDEFSMIGLELPSNAATTAATAFVRAQKVDGSWGDWFPLTGEQASSDGATVNSDPIFVGRTKTVQVALTSDNVASPVLASNTGAATVRTAISDHTTAVLLDPGDGDEAPALRSNSLGIGSPAVITRKQWGANESQTCGSPTINDGVVGAAVHHTAGENDYTPEESAAIVKGIFAYHTRSNGWCDIGYQALIDKYGQVFEGRAGGIDKDVEGAHAGGFNENTVGVAMIGDYSKVKPSQETIDAIGRYLGWRLHKAGIEPEGEVDMVSEGSSFTTIAKGDDIVVPVIFGHRDVNNTECPGEAGYKALGKIRTVAEDTYRGIEDGTIDDESAAPSPSAAVPSAAVPPSGAPESSATVPATPTLPWGTDPSAPATAPTDPNAPGAEASVPPATVPPASDPGAVSPSAVPGSGTTLTAADASTSAIADRWVQLGGDAGPLGTPTSLELEGAPGVRYATFTGGSIYWSAATGAHALYGAIGQAWADLGYERGPLGLPTSAEYPVPGGLQVDFQNGSLFFDSATGLVAAAPPTE